MLGSPFFRAYLSPEARSLQESSYASDVYAFGITMLQVLTDLTPLNYHKFVSMPEFQSPERDPLYDIVLRMLTTVCSLLVYHLMIPSLRPTFLFKQLGCGTTDHLQTDVRNYMGERVC